MSKNASRFARADGLDVHVAEDGLVVFNPATDSVHHLNYTAGTIFELCDGERSAAELAGLLAELHKLDAPPLDATQAGIKQLLDEGVLVEVGGSD